MCKYIPLDVLRYISMVQVSRHFSSHPMKRKAFDAGLPWDLHGYIIRMQIYVRDQLTKNELQLLHLQLGQH